MPASEPQLEQTQRGGTGSAWFSPVWLVAPAAPPCTSAIVLAGIPSFAATPLLAALMATLPGIDANDEPKSLAAFRFYCCVLGALGQLPVGAFLLAGSFLAGCLSWLHAASPASFAHGSSLSKVALPCPVPFLSPSSGKHQFVALTRTLSLSHTHACPMPGCRRRPPPPSRCPPRSGWRSCCRAASPSSPTWMPRNTGVGTQRKLLLLGSMPVHALCLLENRGGSTGNQPGKCHWTGSCFRLVLAGQTVPSWSSEWAPHLLVTMLCVWAWSRPGCVAG